MSGLSSTIGLGLPRYQFHVTFAYLVNWIEAEEAKELMVSAQRLLNEHLTNTNPVTLGAVEFCTFETMHKFTPYANDRSKT